jgi:hypothetical protein
LARKLAELDLAIVKKKQKVSAALTGLCPHTVIGNWIRTVEVVD